MRFYLMAALCITMAAFLFMVDIGSSKEVGPNDHLSSAPGESTGVDSPASQTRAPQEDQPTTLTSEREQEIRSVQDVTVVTDSSAWHQLDPGARYATPRSADDLTWMSKNEYPLENDHRGLAELLALRERGDMSVDTSNAILRRMLENNDPAWEVEAIRVAAVGSPYAAAILADHFREKWVMSNKADRSAYNAYSRYIMGLAIMGDFPTAFELTHGAPALAA